MSLVENLKLANDAMRAVQKLNYGSSNRGAQLDGMPEAISGTRGEFANHMYGFTYGSMLASLGRQDEPLGLASFVAPAAVARRLRFGNCEARSSLALIYAATHSAVRPLELFSVGEDHVFLVIGRTKGHPGNWAEWNAEAVICDAWAEVCYSAGELGQRLQQAPVAAVVGSDPKTHILFEHLGGWPPPALRHFLDEAGLNDIQWSA